MGEYEEAIEALRQAIRADPSNPRAYRSLGVALDLLDRGEEARTTYSDGLKHAPTDIDLQSNYALSLGLMGDSPQALERMRDAATAPSAGVQHLRNYALLLALAGRKDEAKRIAADALEGPERKALMAQIKEIRALDTRKARLRALATVPSGVG